MEGAGLEGREEKGVFQGAALARVCQCLLGENEGVGASVILPGRKAPPFLGPTNVLCRQEPTCSPFPQPRSCQAQVPYWWVTDTPSSPA